MLKPTLTALTIVIGATAALPSVASAIDNGPCDHCTMDPIVVKGDRDADEDTSTKKPIKGLQTKVQR